MEKSTDQITNSSPGQNAGNGLGYGICFQSILPVRKEPGHRNELVTQLLFGEHYKVIGKSPDNTWIKIENAYDQYKGWIDSKQYFQISKDYYNLIDSMKWPLTKDLIGLLQAESKIYPLVYGSVLPIFNNGVVLVERIGCKYQGEVFFPSVINEFAYLYSVARFYLAAPYLWGGRTPFGIDCSGLVQQVFRICGYKLPRDASQQALSGTDVLLKDVKPGDLAFFKNEEEQVTHVGIVCEYNNIIHASGEVRIDKLDENGIFNVDTKTYSHFFHSVKRVLS